MRKLAKLLSLSVIERRLFLRAVFIVVCLRFKLRFLPFEKLKGALSKPKFRFALSKSFRSCSLDQIVRNVKRVVRFIPGKDTCLVRAMAAQILCLEEGYPVRFHIGVSKDERDLFKAHAWVENEGHVLIGEEDRSFYQPLFTARAEGS